MADPKEGVKDLQSGLGQLIDQLGGDNARAFDKIGLAFSTVADFFGAVVGVGQFISLLVSIFNKGSDELQSVQTTLQKAINQLGQAQAGQALSDRLTNIQNQTAKSLTMQQSLGALAKLLPLDPLQAYNILTAQGGPLEAVNALAPPDVSGYGCGGAGLGGPWFPSFDYQIFWDDSDSPDNLFPPPLQINDSDQPPNHMGYGKQAPPSQGNNVFNYTYILPAYCYAVSVFVSAAALIDPKFTESWGDTVIRPTACLFQSVHDFILSQAGTSSNGFTQLSPNPPIDGQSLTDVFDAYLGLALNEVASPGQIGITLAAPYTLDPKLFAEESLGVSIEYGAVDKFSGYNSVGMYTILATFLPDLGEFHFPSGPNYQGKLQIRVRRRAKDVYANTLLGVWNTINNLKNLVGDAPLPAPKFSDWSFRNDITPSVPLQQDGSLSLRDVVTFITQTPPADVPPSPVISFRNLLSV